MHSAADWAASMPLENSHMAHMWYEAQSAANVRPDVPSMSEQYCIACATPVVTVVADMLKLKRYKAPGRKAHIGLAST
jgi:hypothetical protein